MNKDSPMSLPMTTDRTLIKPVGVFEPKKLFEDYSTATNVIDDQIQSFEQVFIEKDEDTFCELQSNKTVTEEDDPESEEDEWKNRALEAESQLVRLEDTVQEIFQNNQEEVTKL